MINMVQMAAQYKNVLKQLCVGHITKSLTISSRLYTALNGPCSVLGRSVFIREVTLCARNTDLAYCRLSGERVTVREIWVLRYIELLFCLLFCMGVKLGRSHWGRNVDLGCLSMGYWGEYLGLRGKIWNGIGENYIMKSLMICTAHQILYGWSNREEWDG